jgi:hypothetical protein
MFTAKQQKQQTHQDPSTAERVRKLESGIQLLNVTAEFFPGCKINEGERLEDLAARSIGITREAFDETFRYLRSIAAGRVIPRE